MHAHLVQSDIAWEDQRENHRRIAALLADTRPAPGDFVLLPEMFDTGFSFNLSVTADHDGATLAFLRDLAARHAITLQGSRTVLNDAAMGLNRATIVGPTGDLLAEYDKIHPFSFGKETERFVGGSQVITYPWIAGPGSATTICPAICYDLRFPELFRRGMLMGAEVLALGANWPASRATHRRALAIARAIENQAYMLCVNRAGSDPHLAYAGGSIAVDPKGQVLAEGGEHEQVLSVPIDLPALRAWRQQFPAWKDAKLLRDSLSEETLPR